MSTFGGSSEGADESGMTVGYQGQRRETKLLEMHTSNLSAYLLSCFDGIFRRPSKPALDQRYF